MNRKGQLLIPLGLVMLLCFSSAVSHNSPTQPRKNLDMYSEKEVFLISDENWRDVLQVVPVTTWSYPREKTVHKYPTLIYHQEGNNFDADAIIRFLQQYNPSHLTIFGDTPPKLYDVLIASEPTGAGLQTAQISQYKMNKYLSFWENTDRVIISEDDYETGLMASVMASYHNAPLFFDGHFDYEILNNRFIIRVGEINPDTEKQIWKRGVKTTLGSPHYSLAELREAYVKWTGTNKVILVNPDDLNIAVNKEFTPEKSSAIHTLHTKHSLAAPFLAAAKFEVIISTTANTYLGVDNYVENILDSLNLPGPLTYLTIVASPRAIPMARENRNTHPALWGNKVVFEELDPSKVDSYPLELHLLTFETNDIEEEPIPVNARWRSPAFYYKDRIVAIYEDKIVWQDWRNSFIPWWGDVDWHHWDIYMYDLETGEEIRITSNDWEQEKPAIYEDKIVWQDNRNVYEKEGKWYEPWDIYMYDLETKEEIRITTDKSDQINPVIYGDKIVWQDNRNGNWDIYMYDLKTENPTQITFDTHDQINPAIYEDKIVWQDNRNGNWDIYMYDPAQGGVIPITTKEGQQEYPTISEMGIVWEDNRNGNYDVYIYYFGQGETRLTWTDNDQIRPVIQGDNVIWYSEGYTGVAPGVAPHCVNCWGNWFTYFYEISTETLRFYGPHLLSHEHASDRQEVDGRFYGSSTNYGHQDRAVGRIFGISPSDVSSYIARVLFFDDLPKNRDALLIVREDWQEETVDHPDPNIVGPVHGPTLEDYARKNYWTQNVRNQFNMEHFYAGTDTGSKPVDTNMGDIRNLYDECYLILYADHGGPLGFSGYKEDLISTQYLQSNSIALQPSTILNLACATGAVLWGYVPDDNMFGMENIRRGAMVYMGAVDVSYWHRMFDDILEGVFLKGKTIGEAYMEARNEDYDVKLGNACRERRGDAFYALFGDPTFKPKWW